MIGDHRADLDSGPSLSDGTDYEGSPAPPFRIQGESSLKKWMAWARPLMRCGHPLPPGAPCVAL